MVWFEARSEMGTSHNQTPRANGLQPAPECSSETFSETTVVDGDVIGTKDGQDTLRGSLKDIENTVEGTRDNT